MKYAEVRSSDLDCYRAIAIIGVVSVHCNQQFLVDFPKFRDTVPEFILNIPSLGLNGLFLFFVLSGYLMEELYGFSRNTFSVRRFFVSRFARISPLWFIFFFVGAVQFVVLKDGPWINAGVEMSFRHLFSVIFLSSTFTLFFAPKWWNVIVYGGASIQTEIQFYLIFPFLRKVSSRLLWKVSIPIFVFDILRKLAEQQIIHGIPRLFVGILERSGLLTYLPFFIVGIYLSRIHHKQSVKVLVILFWLILIRPTRFWDTISAVIFFLCAYILVKIQLQFKLALRLSEVISITSYFVFFVHFQVLMVINFLPFEDVSNQISGNGFIWVLFFLLYLILVLLTSVLIGMFSWKYIERPVIRLGKRRSWH